MTQSGYDKEVPTSTLTKPFVTKTVRSNENQGQFQSKESQEVYNTCNKPLQLSNLKSERIDTAFRNHLFCIKASMPSLSKRTKESSNSFFDSHLSYPLHYEKAEESGKQPRKEI